MSNELSRVDRTALKFNQGSIVALLVAAFALKLPWLVAFVALIMLVGTVIPSAGGFKLIYAHVLRPLKILRPEVVEEDNIQHLFAQGLGGIFLVVAFSLLVDGRYPLWGWGLSFLVIALAFINLTVNFCVGCYLYLRLRRISFFTKAFLRKFASN